MSRIHVKKERVINARPEAVFEAISDYKAKRRQMLTPNFLDYSVERGGHGSGTMLRYLLRSAGRERPHHISVQEPVKGQVLIERDTDSSLVTTWSVLPTSMGRKTKVSVESEWTGGRGIGGFFERMFAPRGLRHIYDRMLTYLAKQVEPQMQFREMREEGRRALPGMGVPFLVVGGLSTAALVARYMQKK